MTVSHIRQLPLEALNGLDLLPLASIECPLVQIANTGRIRFQRELDDLDYHDISALAFDGEGIDPLVFALRAYRGAPPDTVDILLPSEWLGAPELRRTIADIAGALGIPTHRIGWPADAGQPTTPNGSERRLVRH